MDIDYTLDIGGEKVEITYNDQETRSKEQIKILKAYYLRFLKSKIDTTDSERKEKLINRIVDTLSDDAMIKVMNNINTEEGQADNIETVNELIDAYDGVDFENIIDEEINGNSFEYKKGFDIDSVKDVLFSVGEQVKGQKWRVELDEEGKVVLFE